MKKILNFLCNSKKGQGVILGVSTTIIISLFVGLILLAPILWLGDKTYDQTWMNQVAPYFFYPFGIFAAFMCVLFAPYLVFITRTERWQKNVSAPKWVAKFCAIILGAIPGGIIYGLLVTAIQIPSGPHNLIGLIVFGWLYVNIAAWIMKRPFGIAEEFIPLT